MSTAGPTFTVSLLLYAQDTALGTTTTTFAAGRFTFSHGKTVQGTVVRVFFFLWLPSSPFFGSPVQTIDAVAADAGCTHAATSCGTTVATTVAATFITNGASGSCQ